MHKQLFREYLDSTGLTGVLVGDYIPHDGWYRNLTYAYRETSTEAELLLFLALSGNGLEYAYLQNLKQRTHRTRENT